MELIVAVYEDWGIGRDGTQPLTLQADRKFFRETTRGAMVILGRKTLGDFPGGRPLPGRENLVLSHGEVPGVRVCRSPEEAAALGAAAPRAFVIGGGSVYRQMLPYCDAAYVTRIHAQVDCDTWFPDLDRDPCWRREALLASGEEQGIPYEIWRYVRLDSRNTC